MVFFSYSRCFMAYLKMHNTRLYNRLDSKRVREQVVNIRQIRRRNWRDVVLPKGWLL